MPINDKPIKPEKRFQAAVVREAKITALLSSTRQQEGFLATAKWECALGARDVSSQKKWEDEKLKYDATMTNKTVKTIRRAKLEELYRNDDIMYQEELNKMGLAFRLERT